MKAHVIPPPEWDCKIQLSFIHKSGEPYRETFELPMEGLVEHWGQSYTSLGPIRASFDSNYAGDRILAHITVAGNFSLPCSRCLEETGLAIVGDMRYLFTLRSPREDERKFRSHDDEIPEADGDVDVIPLDGFNAELDLVPYIWEVLILNLPERVLCVSDCLGLCPICGCNKNERNCDCILDVADPRFEVLRNLK
ncbi:MAG: DUF177 domain-containing protein [Synergistaceae bacterium]|jgi:uncharacterized protein|nr:DUF177 domain-containing protein [Synergistaceae bacterium]